MKNKNLNRILGTMIMLLIAMITMQGVASAQDSSPVRSIEGVWQISVTPKNCATGVPVPGAAFEALITFHKGGTLSAWFQNPTITVTRSPGHGLWNQDHGWSDYSFKFVHLRYNLVTGAFIGKQVASVTLVLSESGNEFTADGSNTLFDVNGNPTGTGCSDSHGVRFEMD